MEFMRKFDEESSGSEIQLPYLFIVLPICFTEELAYKLARRSFSEGGFLKAMAQNGDLMVDVQEKMEYLFDMTFQSMWVCCNVGVFQYYRKDGTIRLLKKRKPKVEMNERYTNMLAAARRLGAWTAQMSPSELIINLGVKF